VLCPSVISCLVCIVVKVTHIEAEGGSSGTNILSVCVCIYTHRESVRRFCNTRIFTGECGTCNVYVGQVQKARNSWYPAGVWTRHLRLVCVLLFIFSKAKIGLFLSCFFFVSSWLLELDLGHSWDQYERIFWSVSFSDSHFVLITIWDNLAQCL
jgi:hypothetical protein